MAVRAALTDGIVEVVLDARERLNATTRADWAELAAVLTEFSGNERVRGLVMRGEGKAFCAGADLDLLDELRAMTVDDRIAVLGEGSAMLRQLVRFPAPTVAVVDGASYGVGASLALACDRIVATPRAKFGFVFTGLGIPAGDFACTWLLCRRVGTRAAWRLLERAAVVSGEAGLAIGLVDALEDASSDAIAGDLDWSTTSPGAVRTTKRQVLEIEGAFAELEQQMDVQLVELAEAMSGPDFAEGLASVRGRRPARFQ